MSEIIKPNTFLIGAQKAATTSLYDSISKHPEICAPSSLKDIPFFIRDDFFNKGFKFLHDIYKKYYKNEKIVLQGCVNYIFFEKSLERIHKFSPNSKFILILRNPVDRAISSYFYTKQRGLDTKDIIDSFKNEKNIYKSNDYHDLGELTYKGHSLYAKQLKVFFKYFKKEQLCILLFDDLKKNPPLELKKVFAFLEVSEEYEPTLNYLNKTGEPRSKLLNKIIHKDNILKRLSNKYLIGKIFSFDFKVRTKKFLERIASKKNDDFKKNIPKALISELKDFFRDDIEELEIMIDKDLSHWKK